MYNVGIGFYNRGIGLYNGGIGCTMVILGHSGSPIMIHVHWWYWVVKWRYWVVKL